MRDGLGGVQRVALIGGTSEIGLAIARQLADLGAQGFILTGRDPDRVMEAADGLPVEKVVALDLDAPEVAAETVASMFDGGDVDVVVLSAGVLHTDPTPTEIAEMAVVNGSGSLALLGLLAERLVAQGHGHLVVLSSIAVVRPRPSNFWYGASKAGLDFASLGLIETLTPHGVRVSLVRPGFVRTKMTAGMKDAPFACTPKDVGKAVTRAVGGDVGGVVWVPAILKWVSVLLKVLPPSLLKRLDR